MTAKIKKGGTRGTLFKEIAKMRLKDAKILLDAKRDHGAIYLVGYAVECALKWAVTSQMNVLHLPSQFETHNLDELMEASGLYPSLKKAPNIASLFSSLVDQWGPHGRYTVQKILPGEADCLYNHARQVYQWIIENKI